MTQPTQDELNEIARRADWFDHDSGDLIHGMTVAFLIEAFAAVLIALGLHLWGLI